MALKIALALDVSLDYLAGNTNYLYDKALDKRIKALQHIDDEQKKHLFALMDAFISHHKKVITDESNSLNTYLASEQVLAKDWLLAEEDEAWKDL